MVVGSQRCDWMRSDAQVGCLVCALPREHTKLPREQKPKGQGRAGETRETDASIEPRTGGAAVRLRPGDWAQNLQKKPWGLPTAPTDRRPPPAMPAHAPRAPGGALRPPEFTPTLSLGGRISQRHIVVARAVGSAHAPPPSETDARASPQRRRPHRARAGQRPRRK